MTKADYELFEKWADDCLRLNAYIGSKEAFTIIGAICNHAAKRGQRKPKPRMPPVVIPPGADNA